ncbi:MAG: TonB-dependent receptor plug domain-containing protein [Candidatus Deferrimicrobiaceae bacterium]
MQGEERYQRTRIPGRPPCPAVLLAMFLSWGAAPSVAAGPVEMDPVVVTATRIEEKVSEQASPVSVVTREEIELSGAVLVGDALQGLPGVDVQRKGSPGSMENIKIRGGLASHTLVLIDGFPVNSPAIDGAYDVSTLPVGRFDRIDVVRGPQSALYGSNAMSGVVNFLPPRPEGPARFGAGAAAGSFSTLQWNGFAAGGAGGGGYHLGVGGLTSEGIHPNDDTSIVSFLGGGDVPGGERNRFHALVLSTEGEKGVPIDFGTPHDINHQSARRGLLVGGRWETKISSAFTVTASGSRFDEYYHDRDPADPGEANPYVYDDVLKTVKTDVAVMARIATGERSVTFAGFEFTKNRATDTLQSNFGDTNTADTSIDRSVFLQEEWRSGKGAGVSAGLRVDRDSKAGTVLSPRVAAFHDLPGVGARLRAAAGKGFRTPTISETSDPFLGNPALSPEVTWSYEVGADIALAGGEAALSMTWFFQEFRDLIQFDDTVPGPVGFGQLSNVGKSFSRGVELGGTWQLNRVVGLAGTYTYSDTWNSTTGQRIQGVPTQRGSVSILLTPTTAFTGRVDWRLESDELDVPPNGGDPWRPGYARVDLHARYLWRTGSREASQVALTGKVQNLLDRDYEERKGYPAPGINFLFGAEVSI